MLSAFGTDRTVVINPTASATGCSTIVTMCSTVAAVCSAFVTDRTIVETLTTCANDW
jgi:hypothetical protein